MRRLEDAEQRFDALVRRAVRTLLSAAGFVVREAHDGHAAIEWLLRDPEIAAILTDQDMPRARGTDLMDVVRALRPSLRGRVVFHSGRAVAAGEDYAVLPKPARPATLIAAMRAAVEGERIASG